MNTGPNVFVVDDDDGVRDALHMVLGMAGFAVEAYSSADTFLAAYDGQRPGCLITDIRMPDMDGLTLQAELRTRGWPLSVIVITGHGDSVAHRRAMKQGAVAFLHKPFKAAVLLQQVRGALQSSPSQPRLQSPTMARRNPAPS